MNRNNHLCISSTQNERVKAWSSLLDKKYRDRTQQFIIEGIHLIQEALKHKVDLDVIVYDSERGVPEELVEAARTTSHKLEWVQASRAVMARCTGTDTPPPVFAVVNKLSMDHSRLYSDQCFVVVLDGVRDPGNAGTIIRSADAVGADAVILGKGCVDLYNPKTVRSTMGSLFHLPIIEADLSELLPKAKERHIHLVGTSLQANHSCYSYDWTQPTWLLMGNEANGLSDDVRESMTDAVIIPMVGESESLNVAMATTVLAYEALRQRKFK